MRVYFERTPNTFIRFMKREHHKLVYSAFKISLLNTIHAINAAVIQYYFQLKERDEGYLKVRCCAANMNCTSRFYTKFYAVDLFCTSRFSTKFCGSLSIFTEILRTKTLTYVNKEVCFLWSSSKHESITERTKESLSTCVPLCHCFLLLSHNKLTIVMKETKYHSHSNNRCVVAKNIQFYFALEIQSIKNKMYQIKLFEWNLLTFDEINRI